MNKIFIILLTILFLTNSIEAKDTFRKSGFLTIENNLIKSNNKELTKIESPQDKIILIFNHGQEWTDKKSKDCLWFEDIVNMATFVKENKISEKEILLYGYCTDHLQGDSYQKNWEEKKKLIPYKGRTKMDKRVEAISKLTDTFVELGVPRKQIFLAGFSCGGWASLLVMSQYPEKIAGAVAFMPACYGWVSKNGIKKQTGYVPGFMPLREKEINIMKNSTSLPALVFTNPDDIFEGKTSYWMKDLSNLKFIETPSKKNKKYEINGQKCFIHGNGWKDPLRKMKRPGHFIWAADCFQNYFPDILNYLENRIS